MTEKNNFLMVSLLHKYYVFILEKVENKINKKKKAKIIIKSSILSQYFNIDILWYTDLSSRRKFYLD